MKKVFLLSYYDLEGHYKGTFNVAFETRDLAKGYAMACDNKQYKFAIYSVEIIKQYETK